MAWSAWKSIGSSKPYVFETTLVAILGNDTTMHIPLNEEFCFTHNLHLSNPEDYICVIEIDGQFTINHGYKSDAYTINNQLIGINTTDFTIGGYARAKSVETSILSLIWNISVDSEKITFSFKSASNSSVGSFSMNSKASLSKVKIYLFKP